MATWQFKLELVPRQWVEGINGNVQALFDGEGYDTSVAWEQYQPSVEVEPLVEAILPKGKSWHSDLHSWGDEELSDIQVWYKTEKLESITVRVDLREEVGPYLSKIADIAAALECLIFAPEMEAFINPNAFDLGKAAVDSKAAKFVKDPEGFLRNLGSA